MAENLPVIVTPTDDRAARLAATFAASAKTDHTATARRRDLAGASRAGSPAWLPWCVGHGVDPLGDVRPAHLLAWQADLRAAGDAESTRNRRLSTVSAWYRWLEREHIVGRNPAAGLDPGEKPKPAKKIHRVSPTTTPSGDEVRRLLEVADAYSPTAASLLGLLALTGCRVGELVAADVEDIGWDRGAPVLDLLGKGGAHRVVPLPPAAWRRVQVLIEARTAAAERLPAVEAGARPRRPLLASATGRRLLRQDLANLLTRVARRAGLAHLGLTPHALRNAFITDLLADGVPIYDVQRSAGHVSPETTMRYDKGHLDPDRHPVYRRAAQLSSGRPDGAGS
jgi:integrase/recombinase XerD